MPHSYYNLATITYFLMTTRRNQSMPHLKGAEGSPQKKAKGLQPPEVKIDELSESFYHAEQISKAQNAISTLLTLRQGLEELEIPAILNLRQQSPSKLCNELSPTLNKKDSPETKCIVSRSVTKQIMKELVGPVSIRHLGQMNLHEDFKLPIIRKAVSISKRDRKNTSIKPEPRLSLDLTNEKASTKVDFELKGILERGRLARKKELMIPLTEKLQEEHKNIIRSLSIPKGVAARQAGKSKKRGAKGRRKQRLMPKIEWEFANNVYGNSPTGKGTRSSLVLPSTTNPMSLQLPILAQRRLKPIL